MSKHRQLRPDNTGKTIKRLFSYLKFNKILLVWGIIFIILSSIAQIGTNAMLSPIIDTLVKGDGMRIFIKYLIIMGMLVIVISISEYLGNLFMARLAQRTIHKIREDMFSHMEKLPISYFDRNSHGDLMSTFTNDVDMLNQAFEQGIPQITVSVITVVGTFIMMLFLSPLLV